MKVNNKFWIICDKTCDSDSGVQRNLPRRCFEKVKGGGRYLKEILILNSFSLEDKDPISRLKPGLALRLLSKGLFYIRAMAQLKIGQNSHYDNEQ
jgi:hypothetical protein